eukprot:symbB.v1.2.040872.t1/scaffold7609.1/size10284/1
MLLGILRRALVKRLQQRRKAMRMKVLCDSVPHVRNCGVWSWHQTRKPCGDLAFSRKRCSVLVALNAALLGIGGVLLLW